MTTIECEVVRRSGKRERLTATLRPKADGGYEVGEFLVEGTRPLILAPGDAIEFQTTETVG